MSRILGKRDKPRPPRPVRKLSRRLDVARQIHELEQDTALDIVDIERLRVSITRSLWVFLIIGSLFTTTGVHDFLAGRLPMSDPVWWGCWGVEPCMVGILITMLRWEAAMIIRSIPIASHAVTWLKWFLLLSTLIMNVISAVLPSEGRISPGMVAAHVMVPILVFFLAEVMPVVQARCTQARRAVTLPTPVVAKPPTRSPSIDTASLSPTVTAPVVALDGLGIPIGIQTHIRGLAAQAGGHLSAADIHHATRLPLAVATKVAERLSPNAPTEYAH